MGPWWSVSIALYPNYRGEVTFPLVGSYLGVFGDFIIPEKPSPFHLGYQSSVKLTKLIALEDQLKTLWSPLWPEKEFGAIDRGSAEKGAKIFKQKLENNQSCWDCHGEIKREDPNRSFKMRLFATGTDAFARCFLVETGEPQPGLEAGGSA